MSLMVLREFLERYDAHGDMLTAMPLVMLSFLVWTLERSG